MYVKGFGQYSVNAKDNWIGTNFSRMVPQSNYGGGMGIKVTDNWGFEGGLVRELNPMTGKWETGYYFAPVFWKKK